jgi:hypothetical protein
LSGVGPEELVRVSQRLLAAIVGRVLASTYTVLDSGFECLSVELVGGVGVVNGVQRAEVAMTDGEPVVSRSAFTDVFVPTERGWRIRVARSVELEAWPGSGKEDGGRQA